MNRRTLLLVLGAWGALAAARARAQAKTPRLIGWLSPLTQDGQKILLGEFTAQLKLLGYDEGKDYVIEGRWPGSTVEALAASARELVARNPAAIVTMGTAAIAALKNATTRVPIVFTSAADPVGSGFVATLARPAGNITGVTLRSELNDKLVELLRETLPAARRIAILEHVGDPAAKFASASFRKAATALRFESSVASINRIEDIERAFAETITAKATAVVVPQFSLFVLHAKTIADLALQNRLPLFATFPSFTNAGGLLSYSSDVAVNYRRAAVMVDKILKGAVPADLPVEQPDRYTLIINRRTAATLGIVIPQSVLLRADEVIE